MAERRTRRRKKSDKSKEMDLPKGVKVNYKVGGDADDIEKDFQSSYNVMAYLRDQEEIEVAFLEQPEDFPRFYEHRISTTGPRGSTFSLIPCTDDEKCPICRKYPDNRPSLVAYAPVYSFDNKRVQFFRCTPTTWKDMRKRAERNAQRFIRQKWIISRDGEGTDTKYTLDTDNERIPKDLEYQEEDVGDVLNRQMKFGWEQAGVGGKRSNDDDEDDDFEDNFDDEDDELDDDAWEDEEEESRSKTKRPRSSRSKARRRSRK